MTRKKAIDILQDVRSYLSSLEFAVVNEGLASHSYVEICQAITILNEEPKTGHWIRNIDFGNHAYYVCSECGEKDTSFNYCSNCGARMEVSR